ncbi:plasmid replication, integration and excision activator [Nonomuraea roseola]|uniref:Plasmid replication, integration and excision activator n=1 Tax=Nonomuraea roseola TaxID=46179 RepID=A0ABV5PPM0_9ACTN
MALQGPIPVQFGHVFPYGCYAVGGVEMVKDFDASSGDRVVQARDKQTGELVWQIPVMDADPSLKAAQKTVAVKIVSPVQPVPPPPANGMPFTPVEFDGMTVTPYVNAAGRLAYSIKSADMHAPRVHAKPAASAKDAA